MPRAQSNVVRVQIESGQDPDLLVNPDPQVFDDQICETYS
jgi:hypothetical protein